nr:MAG TPA: hypothetical protein [Caudoviricetes sp.]
MLIQLSAKDYLSFTYNNLVSDKSLTTWVATLLFSLSLIQELRS